MPFAVFGPEPSKARAQGAIMRRLKGRFHAPGLAAGL
jgi:hypothetical protein